MMKIRVGFGFDVHQLKEGLNFCLGGIIIPHSKGSHGHSDADVLIHTICDALLGAANMGDIGKHFPDTSPEYKGIDSKILLKEVVNLINQKEYTISNIDSTICLQKPTHFARNGLVSSTHISFLTNILGEGIPKYI